MKERISEQTISQTLQQAVSKDLFDEDHLSILFHDLDYIRQRVERLKNLFPASTLHTIAIKANPLPKILEYLKDFNVGAEGATLPEVYLAEKSGYEPSKIVFDSPAKTYQDLEYVLKRNFHINLDSFGELDRLDKILADIDSHSNIGLRINPQIGTGKIKMTSTAGEYSKFGEPLDEKEDEIIKYYKENNWLNAVHLHIGSQGNPIGQLIDGIEKVYKFVEKLNTIINGQIKYFDIGGGFPVSYRKDKKPPSFQKFHDNLKNRCPNLFNGKYQLITEYGRSIHANSCWTASKVEYIKQSKQVNTAVIHVGADLFTRRCYLPDMWYHEISVYNSKGEPKTGAQDEYNIVGPLCFSGDILARNIELPKIEAGDYIVIHDTGAYTLSMWNRHLSRQIPLAVGYHNSGEKFITLKEKESLHDVYNFWQ